MKVIIYLRTSTEIQSPENQLQDCNSINSYGDAEVIIEKESAWKDNKREKFEEIISRIKKGEIEHLICWDLDRLYRNRKKLAQFLELCKVFNCKIHSYRQKFLEDIYKIPEPWGEYTYNNLIFVLGWIAEEESSKKSERIKIAYRNSKKKWGRKPLSDSVKKEIIQLRDQGLSIREIADSVTYWDKHNNRKFVSRGVVHKTLQEDTSKH